MSAPPEFDLSEFCSAVERCDAATQLRFYANDARVQLTSLADPAKQVRTLVGRAAVEPWINERCADQEVTYRVVCNWLQADEVMMTAERHGPDGTSELSASTAQVAGGLIASQSVVVINTT